MERRTTWCDGARILAIILVVLVHCVEIVYKPEEMLSADTIGNAATLFLRTTLFTAGRVGVPLFLMLSGYLLLPREYEAPGVIKHFYRHNFLPLLLTTEIWIVIYILYMAKAWGQFSLGDSVRYLLFLQKVPLSHMWYMPIILSLYVSIPFVGITLQRCRVRSVGPVLLFAFLVGFLLPTVNNTLQCFGTGIPITFQGVTDWSGGTFGLYLAAGYILGRKMILQKVPSRVLVITAVLCLLLADAVQGASYYFGTSPYRIYYTHPLILALSLAVFELLRRRPETAVHGKSLEMFSRLSFGVFFLHNLVLMEVLAFINFGNVPRAVTLFLLLASGLAISYGISYLLFLNRHLRRWLLKA